MGLLRGPRLRGQHHCPSSWISPRDWGWGDERTAQAPLRVLTARSASEKLISCLRARPAPCARRVLAPGRGPGRPQPAWGGQTLPSLILPGPWTSCSENTPEGPRQIHSESTGRSPLAAELRAVCLGLCGLVLIAQTVAPPATGLWVPPSYRRPPGPASREREHEAATRWCCKTDCDQRPRTQRQPAPEGAHPPMV